MGGNKLQLAPSRELFRHSGFLTLARGELQLEVYLYK
jgi:hypothetical protein